MSKAIKRRCEACGETKLFRGDQKTCGCKSDAFKGKDEQVLYFRRRAELAEADNKKLRESLGEQKEILSVIRTTVEAVEPFPNQYQPKSRKKTLPEVAAGICLGDWHTGEVISPEETEGFGGYDFEIEQKRIFNIVDEFLKYVDVQRDIYKISHCAIFGLADWVSGNIHYELEVTNEFPAPVAAVKAGLLLGEVVRRISAHFETVDGFEISIDNHGRFTRKNQHKQGGFNNWSYVVNTVANVYASKCSNFTPTVASGMKLLADVLGKKFLVEHGHTLKSWMGIPFYGIDRQSGREAMRRMGTDLEFDYQVYGHYHVPNFMYRRVLMNGSLSGTSEFDSSVGRHSGPAQVVFLVHPKHGVFNFSAFDGR